MQTVKLPVEDTCGPYGIRPSRSVLPGPRYPAFRTFEQRLATFADWPKSLKQKPEEMAEAGFFYIGSGDRTACFYCGVGWKDWEETDVPWEEHERWSPECAFLNLHRDDRAWAERVNGFMPGAEEEAELKKVASDAEKRAARKNGPVEERAACKVCYDNEVGVVFMPCGHAACLDCALVLKSCHICRAPIERFVRVYMA